MRILVVEDENAMATGLQFNFEQEGYQVAVAHNGHKALKYFDDADHPFDLVIVDLMLPGLSGYEVCCGIRKHDQDIPILVLSARTLSEDKTMAFDCGTDQYMTKPFALPELLSRVRNLLERRRPAEMPEPRLLEPYEFGDVRVDFNKFEVQVGQTVHSPTTIEMQLLRYFIENEGRVLSRPKILQDVWEQHADITTRTIDNFVMRLRRMIEPKPNEPQHIRSVRGTGYRFVAEPDDE